MGKPGDFFLDSKFRSVKTGESKEGIRSLDPV